MHIVHDILVNPNDSVALMQENPNGALRKALKGFSCISAKLSLGFTRMSWTICKKKNLSVLFS